jgi:hypothetical protein
MLVHSIARVLAGIILCCMDATTIQASLQKFSVASECFTTSDKINVAKCAHAVASLTHDKCMDLVTGAGDQALLIVHMSDGWSTWVKKSWNSHADCRRVSKQRHEFVLERVLVKTYVDGLVSNLQMAMKVGRPRRLAERKCWNLFTSSTDFFPLAKAVGHCGITLTMYIQDGLMVASFVRRQTARHALFFSPAHHPHLPENSTGLAQAADTDLNLGMRCALHSGSSAIKWGLQPLASKELLEDVHIGIASLQNSGHQLNAQLDEFIRTCVSYRDEDLQNETVCRFWQCLGVSPANIDKFVAVNPEWNGEVLLVNKVVKSDPDAFVRIKHLLLVCMRWISFSETRWGGTGPCGREYLLSRRVGLVKIVALALHDSDFSNYYLNGHSRIAQNALTFLGAAALMARPLEAVMLELLDDDRLLMHAETYKECQHDEVQFLLELEVAVWVMLADLIHLDGGVFRNIVLRATFGSCAYFHFDVWIKLTEYPLVLTQGNINFRLDELCADTTVQDVFALKVQRLLTVWGFARTRVAKALTLLKEASCTISLVEKSHASGAQLSKFHEQFGECRPDATPVTLIYVLATIFVCMHVCLLYFK